MVNSARSRYRTDERRAEMRVYAVLALLICTLSPAAAQNSKPARPHGISRMPDGHPDLQGTYDLATLTPLERPPGTPLVLTKDEAAKLERQVADRTIAADAPIDAN